jgi:hypothetical protein
MPINLASGRVQYVKVRIINVSGSSQVYLFVRTRVATTE